MGYDPNQMRDDHGRWSSDGGQASLWHGTDPLGSVRYRHQTHARSTHFFGKRTGEVHAALKEDLTAKGYALKEAQHYARTGGGPGGKTVETYSKGSEEVRVSVERYDANEAEGRADFEVIDSPKPFDRLPAPRSAPQPQVQAAKTSEWEASAARTAQIGAWAQRTGETSAKIQAQIARGMRSGKTLEQAADAALRRRAAQLKRAGIG